MELAENKDYIILSRKEFLSKQKQQEKPNIVLVRLFNSNHSVHLNRTIYIQFKEDFDDNTLKIIVGQIVRDHFMDYMSYEVHKA